MSRWRNVVQAAKRLTVHPLRPLKGIWRRFGASADDVEAVRELVTMGAALERLSQSPDWATLLLLKEQVQSVATETARRKPSVGEGEAGDRLRLTAAAEYWALEAFFATLRRTIAESRKAREALAKLKV